MAKKAPSLKKPDLTPEQKNAQEWLSRQKAEPQPPKEEPTKMAKKTATKKKTGPKGQNKSQKARDFHKAHPALSVQEIADKLKFDYGTVYQALKKPGKKKAAAKKIKAKGGAQGGGIHHGNGHHSNGHSAADFVHAAFTLGLDKAIGLLEKVKKAVE